MEILRKNNYYFNTKEDVKLTFIDYGRYLEKNNVSSKEDYSNYEKYLAEKMELEQESDEFKILCETHYKTIPKKTLEYTDFLCYILEQANWNFDLIIIKQEEWDKFYNTDDKDYEMKMNIVKASNFYKEFEKLTGTDMWQFEHCFVSAKYIDNKYYNCINLIIKINGKIERFIVDVV